MSGSLGAIVLAGGRSKRFRSEAPKVLHPAAGRPLIAHVLGALGGVHVSTPIDAVAIVVPPGGEVEAAVGSLDLPFELRFAVQDPPLGTGDAARIGLEVLEGADEVLVCAGDVPLVRPESLSGLVEERRSSGAAVALLSAMLDDPGSYGRVVRSDGEVSGIVEAKDASAEQLGIGEINVSVYAFSADALRKALPRLSDDNSQGEYYLTDAVGILGAEAGIAAVVGAPEEAQGMNTRTDLADVLAVLRRRKLDELMASGVTVIDPGATYVDVGVTVGADTTLLPNTYLEGSTRIGSGCEIGPEARLVDTEVDDGAAVTFAVARDARIGPGASVGPYASLRSGTVLERGAKVGTFVETKEAHIGTGAKVPHLAYMGDVSVGERSNIGAGTITCNYDGEHKHRTTIGDDVFIGTNNSLRAPVDVGDGAYTGAGSVVTHDVASGELVFGNPARPRKRAHEGGSGPEGQRPRGQRAEGQRVEGHGEQGRDT